MRSHGCFLNLVVTWNGQTLIKAGGLCQLCVEMSRHKDRNLVARLARPSAKRLHLVSKIWGVSSSFRSTGSVCLISIARRTATKSRGVCRTTRRTGFSHFKTFGSCEIPGNFSETFCRERSCVEPVLWGENPFPQGQVFWSQICRKAFPTALSRLTSGCVLPFSTRLLC